jgi:hypothetical protein
MARRVYFSFHYDNDIHRVVRIRNSGVIKETGQPFIDKAEWEKLKKSGDKQIEKWIDNQMNGTYVIILCIGLETYKRPWVIHEIKKAHIEKRGIVGIYMNGMKDLNQNSIGKGANPLSGLYISENNRKILLSEIYKTYSWLDNDGYHNIEKWIADAAERAGR